jgi:hypothetical protein
MIQTHSTDTVIEEIHRTRRRMAEKFGGQIAAILDDARRRQAASGRPVWQRTSSNRVMQASGGSKAANSDEIAPTSGD